MSRKKHSWRDFFYRGVDFCAHKKTADAGGLWVLGVIVWLFEGFHHNDISITETPFWI